MTTRLTEHFTLEELAATEHRDIDNTPPPEIIEALTRTAQGLERIRTLVGAPIVVSSGYRCPALNSAIGGARASQHLRGEAADINAIGIRPAELARRIYEARYELDVDQVILEYGRWVHVSFSDRPRRVALTIRSKAEGYLNGILA